ncbi:transcription factor HES-5-like [Salarias fasciatus]|uniref:transcription factor HES-5-like n=1 Tax=Salarias fasciatus TaxID=181472 RepID=UPI0011765360|nr:transcription factor HES-5-like [Salarias fasciatus]
MKGSSCRDTRRVVLTSPADMAPCSGRHAAVLKKSNNRLRKPAVEKKRRDRINSCIKQLKVLLQEDVHTQRLSSKLEKAEILEMTVSLLRQQLQDNAARFLRGTASSKACAPPPPSLQHQEAQRGSSSTLRPKTLQESSGVWRPW